MFFFFNHNFKFLFVSQLTLISRSARVKIFFKKLVLLPFKFGELFSCFGEALGEYHVERVLGQRRAQAQCPLWQGVMTEGLLADLSGLCNLDRSGCPQEDMPRTVSRRQRLPVAGAAAALVPLGHVL